MGGESSAWSVTDGRVETLTNSGQAYPLWPLNMTLKGKYTKSEFLREVV